MTTHRETKRAAIVRLHREGRALSWIAVHLEVEPRRVRKVLAEERETASFPSPEERQARRLDTLAILSAMRQVG